MYILNQFKLTRRHVVCGRVHLDDLHAWLLPELLPQLVVDGGQLLAVAAPGRVELDQGVLAGGGHQVVKVLGNGDLSE